MAVGNSVGAFADGNGYFGKRFGAVAVGDGAEEKKKLM